VNKRNTEKGGKEYARKEVEKKGKDQKEQEERRKMQGAQEEADRMLAEELAAADAKIRKRPGLRRSQRKGNKIIEDAKEAKQQNGGGDMSDSNMKEERGGSLQEAKRGVKRKGDKIVKGANRSKVRKRGGAT
jgi:hypothetical protein